MSLETLTLVLATDRGPGLDPLTRHRAKAAVPFAGKFRIIDFTLANCLHSDLRQVLVLTQYKSHSLHKHLRDGWSIYNPELREYVTPVSPQMAEGQSWYTDPFDAVRQNRYLIERSRAKRVLILQGDLIYRMDYAEMIRAHVDQRVEVTLAIREGTSADSPGRVAVCLDEAGRVVQAFDPASTADPPKTNLLTMGVYLFDKERLLAELDRPAEVSHEHQVLSASAVASLSASGAVFGYRFGGARGRVTPDRYWCDPVTVDAYFEATMALLHPRAPLDLYQEDWDIHTYQGQDPPARTVPGASGTEGIFVNSMLADGTLISGGGVNHSVLFPRVRIRDGAIVEEAVLFDGVQVGEGAHLRRCILDKGVVVPADVQIGLDPQADRTRYKVTDGGLVVIPRGFAF